MKDIEVRIIRLDPMRVASAYGFGPSPEMVAHDKMGLFARSKGLLTAGGAAFRNFGFNNPGPEPGSPNYGYEVWITIGPDVEPEGDIRICQFMGGLYAVTRCERLSEIGQVWQQLVLWGENSRYKMGSHQCLEELLTPLAEREDDFQFDLYLPVVE